MRGFVGMSTWKFVTDGARQSSLRSFRGSVFCMSREDLERRKSLQQNLWSCHCHFDQVCSALCEMKKLNA